MIFHRLGLNILYASALVLGLPWLVWRSIRTKRYRQGLGEKLFGCSTRPAQSGGPSIWLHAVSVGEVQLLRTLVAGLRNRYPNAVLSISTTTDSGRRLADELFPNNHRFYFPFDFSWAVARTFRRVSPDLLILTELEIWPNLISEAARRRCPVVVVNGRLSESSFRGYRRLRCLIRKSFESLGFVAAQDSAYASRFIEMGTPADRVANVGNLKFDGALSDRNHPEVAQRRAQLGLSSQDQVWVVGSTQSPEEQYAIEAFLQLQNEFPELRLIVVPRHPDRFDEVAGWLKDAGIDYRRRSETKNESISDWRVLLGDTVGELRWWWGLADIAFVGGSFGDRGGQNMIEPTALGVSTAVGPNTKNFLDAMRMLREVNGITELQQPSDFAAWARGNLKDAAHREGIGLRASELVISQRGALEKTLDIIDRQLNNRFPKPSPSTPLP
jgi:3-deoxy-D-manno-octulosonic-acid transferase